MTRTAQTRILIDISDSEDDHQEWDEKDWIGVGKSFLSLVKCRHLLKSLAQKFWQYHQSICHIF